MCCRQDSRQRSRRFSDKQNLAASEPAFGHTDSVGSLLIVTGPPGAGKSTIAAELANQSPSSVLVHGDDFFGFLAAGAIEPWLPESHTQNEIVTEAAARATGRFAEDYETVYDGVIGPWLLPTFASACNLTTLDYVVILPPVDICVSRVSTRTGHGFDDEPATRKMHAEFRRETVGSQHLLDTDTWQLEETLEAIGSARRSGRLRYDVGT